MTFQVVFGSSVIENSIPHIDNSLVSLPGEMKGYDCNLGINDDILSKHLLLVGGSGCGKTNTFFYFVDQIKRKMTVNDCMLIFDTKGEYCEKFAEKTDYIIGNNRSFRQIGYSWNIFDEILADGWDDLSVLINTREIAAALFHDRASKAQPFFSNAARDIFSAVLLHFIRSAIRDPKVWKKRLNNACLVDALRRFNVDHYRAICSHYKDLNNLITYFGDGKSNQALGVFGELNTMISEYFVGVFASYKKNRDISMRGFVNRKGGKELFVEYDLSVGETLIPMYRLLFDQALKEALGNKRRKGKVYIITDEFKLLPKLQHIDDALNFGRGLGIRVIAGIQSIDQLYDIYGENKGSVIASGFGSIFAFYANDHSSRDYIIKRFGKNIIIYNYFNKFTSKYIQNERAGNTVEDWDLISCMEPGKAIIGIRGYDPFVFKFKEFSKGEQYE